ncbi:hypothetical protein UFOVP1304_62 [uncultured Caudovirales phage]|uniref:Uncharacterized protein n=1 Tax=uncultured Caudovirales phage TaxID=2100421 RepID=A0A6J5RUC8_9CAUD|nr:hypothetical protein UFOVP1304_62 [uncultured Caudovirales phage]
MFNNLAFKTQNQGPIDTSLCVPVGNIEAPFCDVLQCLGLPRIGGDHIQWDVRFADGCVASVYNWADEPDTVTHWFVSGTSAQGVERVKTLMSLRQEVFHEQLDDYVAGIDAMMADIATKHGGRYADTVQVARLSYKMMSMTFVLIEQSDMPKDVREATRDAVCDMSARIVAHTATLSGKIHSEDDMRILTDYVEAMTRYEQRVAEGLMKGSRSQH